MKYLKIIILLILATSCGLKNYPDRYMAYDAVAIRQEPSEDSPVVAHVSSLMAPRSFRYDRSKPMFYLADSRGVGRPLSVLETDDSGDWGLVKVTDIDHNAAGWVHLSQLSYAGNGHPKTVTPAYLVKRKKVSLYRQPKAGTPLNYWLLQGDTVRLWATAKGGWGHVSSYKTRIRSYEDEPRTGWVQLNQLTPMDSLSYSGVKKALRDEARQKIEKKEKLESKEKGIGGNEADKLIYGGLALLALLLGLILNKTAGVRGKRRELWFSLVACAVILAIQALLTGVPVMSKTAGILMRILGVVSAFCMAFTVLYPLLYIRFIARIWQYIFIIVGGYLVLLSSFSVKHPVFVIILVAGGLWLVVTVARRLQKDVCKHCGYYAAHPVIGRYHEGGDTSRERWRETTKSGGYTVSTRDYSIIRGWSRYTTHRVCLRCGKEFQNVSFFRTERREY